MRVAVLILLGLIPLFASPTGSVTGLIRDPSGAPVPGVHVILLNGKTNAQRLAVSDSSGVFQFLQIEPASWSLTAEAQGFKRTVVQQTLVQVDQVTHVEIVLELGERSEIVEVRAVAPLLESGKSTLSSVVDNRVIADVPLNGRQFLDLALLTPGVVPAAPGTQGSGFNAAGARSQSNVYFLDGISNQDTQTNEALNLFRITDAVQEFAVQTSVPPPEYGRGGGGQVNIVTKSGSNQFHGSLFEYLRNTKLDAADFFTNKLRGPKNV